MGWNNLKAAIAAVIKTNDNQEITGANLQNVLLSIVNMLGANATYAGIAEPQISPGVPDGPVFYIAKTPGTYPNFNNAVITSGINIIKWENDAWVVDNYPLLIADGAVTSAKIADGAVGNGKIANSAVSAEKIASNAVTLAKINSSDIDDNPTLNSQKLVRSDGVKAAINYVLGKVQAIEALLSEDSDPTAAIDKFSEIVAFLSNINNTSTLEGIINGINASINTKYTKPSGGIPESDLDQSVKNKLAKAEGSYAKPSSGIPETDLDQSVKNKLAKAEGSYAKPSSGIPETDLDQSVKNKLAKAESSYAKPSSGIPESDLDQSVKNKLAKAESALQEYKSVFFDGINPGSITFESGIGTDIDQVIFNRGKFVGMKYVSGAGKYYRTWEANLSKAILPSPVYNDETNNHARTDLVFYKVSLPDYGGILPYRVVYSNGAYQLQGIQISASEIANNAVTLAKINSSDIDDNPTLNSQKLVRSGGVKSALNSIQEVLYFDGFKHPETLEESGEATHVFFDSERGAFVGSSTGRNGITTYYRTWTGKFNRSQFGSIHGKVSDSTYYNDEDGGIKLDKLYYNCDNRMLYNAEMTEDEDNYIYTLNCLSIKDILSVEVTYNQLKALRDNNALVPGQSYRITDYVTTVNSYTEPNARSAGHQFDIIVTATSENTLSETAKAIKHAGDTYFNGARLEAWQLKYRLDNVQWSKQTGTYVTDEDNGYTFLVIGDITLSGHTYKLLQGLGAYVDDWADYALMDTLEEGENIYAYYGDPEDFDPEEPEEVGTASSVDVVTEDGKGTITWMKDEHGNECPYDFKNVQFKRYMATDSVSGRDGLGGKYMVADPDNCPQGLSVDDTEDFIWAYTFSSDNSGGEQTDYSLIAEHQVHDNVFRPHSDGLPNNVMFGESNHSNSFGFNCYNNSWGNYCSRNSWGNYCSRNSWGNRCTDNSWGNNCSSNSWGNYCSRNSWGNYCSRNSWGNGCTDNSWGNNCSSNSWGNQCQHNSWGNNCSSNSWGNNITQSTLFEGVQYTQITTENVKNVQVLNGVAGKSSSKLTLTFAANKTYTQVAAMTSAGALKIYVPGDLV